MLARLVAGSVVMTAGLVITALPDGGRSIVSLGNEHGLSALDAVGVALLLGGWLIVAADIWRRRRRVLDRIGDRERIGAAFGTGLGLGLLVASFYSDWWWWWALGIVLLVTVQLVALVLATRS